MLNIRNTPIIAVELSWRWLRLHARTDKWGWRRISPSPQTDLAHRRRRRNRVRPQS